MPRLSYLKALNRALADELTADERVFVLGEDVRVAASNLTAGLAKRFGPDRVIDTPLSEQGFTGFATGAAMAGMRLQFSQMNARRGYCVGSTPNRSAAYICGTRQQSAIVGVSP